MLKTDQFNRLEPNGHVPLCPGSLPSFVGLMPKTRPNRHPGIWTHNLPWRSVNKMNGYFEGRKFTIEFDAE